MITRSALTILLFFNSTIWAQAVHLTLPNQGYFTPGSMMPLEITADDEASRNATIVLRADGALPTMVSMNGKRTVIAPMLMLSVDAGNLSWSIGDQKHSVDLSLQSRSGDESPQPRGVVGCFGGIDAYSPVLAWHPGASPRTMRVAILIGALVAISLAGCAVLLRSNRAKLMTAFVVIILATSGTEIWRRNIPAIWSAAGQIVVADEGQTQIDSWKYFAARSPASVRVDLIANTSPVFIDADHARALNARLLFDGASSTTTLLCDLSGQTKLAVCARRFSTARITTAPSSTTDSPMQSLAQRLYVDGETSILGEGEVSGVSDQEIHWRAVILKSR